MLSILAALALSAAVPSVEYKIERLGSKEVLLEGNAPLELQRTATTGSTYQTAGSLMLAVGVPAIITFLVLALVDPPSKSKVAILPSLGPNGAQVLLRWELP